MKAHIKHFAWFMKESYSFMKGHSRLWITFSGIPKAIRHARFMVKWESLTPQQREAWYLSGEGRTLEF